MVKTSWVIKTDGKTSHWSSTSKFVRVTGLELEGMDLHNENPKYGAELRVHFDKRTWDVKRLGFIYTDVAFLVQLRKHLRAAGYTGSVDYSEQGMQGDGYVSLDASPAFIKQFQAT